MFKNALGWLTSTILNEVLSVINEEGVFNSRKNVSTLTIIRHVVIYLLLVLALKKGITVLFCGLGSIASYITHVYNNFKKAAKQRRMILLNIQCSELVTENCSGLFPIEIEEDTSVGDLIRHLVIKLPVRISHQWQLYLADGKKLEHGGALNASFNNHIINFSNTSNLKPYNNITALRFVSSGLATVKPSAATASKFSISPRLSKLVIPLIINLIFSSVFLPRIFSLYSQGNAVWHPVVHDVNGVFTPGSHDSTTLFQTRHPTGTNSTPAPHANNITPASTILPFPYTTAAPDLRATNNTPNRHAHALGEIVSTYSDYSPSPNREETPCRSMPPILPGRLLHPLIFADYRTFKRGFNFSYVYLWDLTVPQIRSLRLLVSWRFWTAVRDYFWLEILYNLPKLPGLVFSKFFAALRYFKNSPTPASLHLDKDKWKNNSNKSNPYARQSTFRRHYKSEALHSLKIDMSLFGQGIVSLADAFGIRNDIPIRLLARQINSKLSEAQRNNWQLYLGGRKVKGCRTLGSYGVTNGCPHFL